MSRNTNVIKVSSLSTTKMRKRSQSKFSFHFATLEQTMEEVTLLSDKKASRNSDIPVKIIKEN